MHRHAAAVVLLLALAGCGGRSAPNAAETGELPQAETRLTFTASPGGQFDDSLTWTLTCHPTGGDHPDPETACAVLDSVQDPFGPVPKRKGCEEILGGPEVVRVQGVFRGRKVNTIFTRENLCAMDRWDRVEGIFPLEPA